MQALKECADEIDLGTQYHLTRYAFLFESIILNEGTTLAPSAPEDGTFLIPLPIFQPYSSVVCVCMCGHVGVGVWGEQVRD